MQESLPINDIDESAPGLAAPQSRVSVLVPLPVDRAYSYIVPEGMTVQLGDYVDVPLGNRSVAGVVWDEPLDENVPAKKLKTILSVHDLPPMAEAHRKFIDWTAQYNMSPKGFVMKMALSVPTALQPAKAATAYELNIKLSETAFKNLSPARQKIVTLLSDGKARRAAEIADEAGVTTGVIKGLVEMNVVRAVAVTSIAPCRNPDYARARVTLSDAQKDAADNICARIDEGGYHAMLLDGVTGAGKTEVYFEAVASALAKGQQVCLLLPEIALSNAFLERFKSRFGCHPALWHSQLSAGARKRTWRGVASGETKVIVGARSALYLPYNDLGLIIVDEEHDPAYKQEDSVIYNARDMAIVRAHLAKIPIILISATPALETMLNAWNGRYEHIHLPDRHGGATLPDIHLIDMKAEPPEKSKFLSPVLVQALQDKLDAGEQSLLFLNRRGYAPLTLCRTCGHRINCPRCTAWLVEHKSTGKIHCHHCGYHTRTPQNCPECHAEDSLVACGPGVERIHEEVTALFPNARVLILASDTADSHETLRSMLEDIRSHKYDIIIGTQIIAKGHHFPHLTLVGVVDADLGLQGGDLRAAERTYQLLHQVSGRAGRESKQGVVYLQTFVPGNKVMEALAAEERDLFYEIEAGEREQSLMPPFSRLVGVIVSGKDEQQVFEAAQKLGRCAPQAENLQTLGPAEAPFYRLRGNYRRRLLVRADKNIHIQKIISNWLAQVKIPSTVRVYIDIDPQNFL
jgi:primosomal protein N' (replication factor Y)